MKYLIISFALFAIACSQGDNNSGAPVPKKDPGATDGGNTTPPAAPSTPENLGEQQGVWLIRCQSQIGESTLESVVVTSTTLEYVRSVHSGIDCRGEKLDEAKNVFNITATERVSDSESIVTVVSGTPENEIGDGGIYQMVARLTRNGDALILTPISQEFNNNGQREKIDLSPEEQEQAKQKLVRF